MGESVRWPEGPVCPSCGVIDNAVPLATRRPGVYRCRDCGHLFSVTVGTAMEGTHLPLNVWYHAMYLILASSKGISALNLSQQLGLQYRTVWHLCHRIRAMLESGDKTPLAALIEAVCRRVNAGRSDRIAFHQSIHSDIGLARCVVPNDTVTQELTIPALNPA